MYNVMQSLNQLAMSNAGVFQDFAKSPEVVDVANTSVRKSFELGQNSFGSVVSSKPFHDMVRKLTENYSAFIAQYFQGLTAFGAQGQQLMTQQLQDASDRVTEMGSAASEVVETAARGARHAGAK